MTLTFPTPDANAERVARRHLADAQAAALHVPDMPKDIEPLSPARIGVIGAGTMGTGIAMNFANIDLPVTLVETRQDALDRGLATIRRSYEGSARKGRISAADVEQRMACITGTLAMPALADCELVIEAVFEDMAVKKSIFAELDRLTKPGTILATNTSALDVDAIAAATRRPQWVVGLHFFSPAHVMKLLEIVRGKETSHLVLATAIDLATRIGKVAAVVGVCPGFVANRMLFPRQRAAQRMALEGAAPAEIDAALTAGFGFPMGPFAMADLAGLDIGWKRDAGPSEYLPFALCEIGRYGQKNRKGFYDYDDDRKATPSPQANALIEEHARKQGIERRSIDRDEILRGCLLPMINEGALLLEQGIAQRASDIDVIWAYGFGFPAARGGPMYLADQLGARAVVDGIDALAARWPGAPRAAELLRRLAANNRTLASL